MHVRVCRQCGYEYRPEISVCTDCGGSLEDRWDNGSGITHATASPAPDVAKESDLGGYQSILVSWLASDLVPLAERLWEAGIGFRVSETRGRATGRILTCVCATKTRLGLWRSRRNSI